MEHGGFDDDDIMRNHANRASYRSHTSHLGVRRASAQSLQPRIYQVYGDCQEVDQCSAYGHGERVGRKLATAVETYLKQNGFANDVKNYAWEFNLVQDKSANAFCMPGGKIVVYEGLLPYTQNETALAIVLGHEIAHAVAKHSAEQLTKQQNQQVGTNILGNVLNQAVGSGVGDLASAVAGKYFSFRNLKYSRDNETEADYMGLIFAAMAGYDPQQAIPFWKRMSQGNSSNQNDIFSDHPSDAKRIAALQKEMPTALKYYHPAKNTKKR